MPYPVRKTPEVSGNVINSRSKKPVEGAKVSFDETPSVRGRTDRDGHFFIPETRKLGILFGLPFDPAQKHLPLEVLHPDYHSVYTNVPFYSFLHRSPFNIALDPL
jgi:hypothetical protein